MLTAAKKAARTVHHSVRWTGELGEACVTRDLVAAIEARDLVRIRALYLVRIPGETALTLVLRDEIVLQAVLEWGLNPNLVLFMSGMTLLCRAVELSLLPSVLVLLKAGANPNLTCASRHTERSYTPLHLCTRADIAAALISAGAHADAYPSGSGTPLMAACDGGHADVARVLLAAGAAVDACLTQPASGGSRAINRACAAASLACASALIEYGADVNALSSEETAPLESALAQPAQSVALVALLLRHGADATRLTNAHLADLSRKYAYEKRAAFVSLFGSLYAAGAPPPRDSDWSLVATLRALAALDGSPSVAEVLRALKHHTEVKCAKL